MWLLWHASPNTYVLEWRLTRTLLFFPPFPIQKDTPEASASFHPIGLQPLLCQLSPLSQPAALSSCSSRHYWVSKTLLHLTLLELECWPWICCFSYGPEVGLPCGRNSQASPWSFAALFPPPPLPHPCSHGSRNPWQFLMVKKLGALLGEVERRSQCGSQQLVLLKYWWCPPTRWNPGVAAFVCLSLIVTGPKEHFHCWGTNEVKSFKVSSQTLVVSVIQCRSQSVGADSPLHTRFVQWKPGQRPQASCGRGFTVQCGTWEGTDCNRRLGTHWMSHTQVWAHPGFVSLQHCS